MLEQRPFRGHIQRIHIFHKSHGMRIADIYARDAVSPAYIHRVIQHAGHGQFHGHRYGFKPRPAHCYLCRTHNAVALV